MKEIKTTSLWHWKRQYVALGGCSLLIMILLAPQLTVYYNWNSWYGSILTIIPLVILLILYIFSEQPTPQTKEAGGL